jgi:hypothetical protein
VTSVRVYGDAGDPSGAVPFGNLNRSSCRKTVVLLLGRKAKYKSQYTSFELQTCPFTNLNENL